MGLLIKICGITRSEQAPKIAAFGATALGFICVAGTPRYIAPRQIRAIVDSVAQEKLIDRVGVFLNAPFSEICYTVSLSKLNCIQLHGSESVQFCNQLRIVLPDIKLIKAFNIRAIEDLDRVYEYEPFVDALLLDAYDPKQAGGTGQTIDWTILKQFRPSRPWLLAGGLNPENVLEALDRASPDGIDLSSGVESAPGDKNLDQVERLFQRLKGF